MSWDDFIRIARRDVLSPRYLLESVPASHPYSGGHQLGAEVRFSSFDLSGYLNRISVEGSSVSHGSLTPQSWTRTHGGMTVALTIDARDLADVDMIRRIARGQIMQLRMGLGDMDVSGFAPVFTGVVRAVQRSATGMWLVDMADLISGLTTRLTRDGTRAGLFSGLSTTTLASGYTAGAATISVVSAAGFEKVASLDYLIRITPDSGDPFYAFATLSGTTFTFTARGIFDTIDGSASAGNLVEEIAFNEAHPLNLAAQVLTSTGGTGNGGSDTMPERWGIGIPAELVDTDTMAASQAQLQSAQYVAYLRADAEQSDGLSWLSGFLRPFGIFLTMRQGRLTARPVQVLAAMDTPELSAYGVGDTNRTFVDLEHHLFDPDCPVEYGTFAARFGTLTNTAAFTGDTVNDVAELVMSSRPAVAELVWECPDIWTETYDLCTTHDAQTNAWALDICDQRLARWVTRVPERIVVTLNGWDSAGLSIGDSVLVRTDWIRCRMSDPVYDYPGGRYGMILGGGPDWFRGGCTWEIGFPAEIDES